MNALIWQSATGYGKMNTQPREFYEGRCSRKRDRSPSPDCLAKGPPLIAFLGFFFGGFLARDDLGLGVGAQGTCNQQVLARSIGLSGVAVPQPKQWKPRD